MKSVPPIFMILLDLWCSNKKKIRFLKFNICFYYIFENRIFFLLNFEKISSFF